MPTATIYEAAEAAYYTAASDRFQITRSSAEHDAALVHEVVTSIRAAIRNGLLKIEREAHGDARLTGNATDIAALMLEDIGEQFDGPMCSLWHDMCRITEAQALKVAA